MIGHHQALDNEPTTVIKVWHVSGKMLAFDFKRHDKRAIDLKKTL